MSSEPSPTDPAPDAAPDAARRDPAPDAARRDAAGRGAAQRVGIVVDSNSQLPPALAERYGISVVALTVTVDGVDHLEGVDLDADRFYEAWADGRSPEISTSQPSPGAFVAACQSLVDDGATDIVSIHIAASMSGTFNSARLAADEVDARVHLVDTGTASFGISCCAWAAAEARAAGASVEKIVEVAQRRASGLHTSFVVGVPQLIDRSGRSQDLAVEQAATAGVPIIAMTGPDLYVLATVIDLDEAVEAMVDDALAWSPSDPSGLRIAVGTSDASSAAVSAAITRRVTGHRAVADVIQYRIGPSVGAHTGPGTAGLFVF